MTYVCVTSHGVFGPFNNPDVASLWLHDTYPDDHRRGPDDHRGVYALQRPPGVADLFISGADIRNAAMRVVSTAEMPEAPDTGRTAVDVRAFAWLEAAVRADA